MNTKIILVVATFLSAGLLHAESARVQAGVATQSQSQASANSSQSKVQNSANVSTSASAKASAGDGQNRAAISDGTSLNASLSTTLDVKKNKVGDRVLARTTQDVKQNGQVLLPKGTRLIGHVTQVKVRGKESAQSSLGIIFDRAELRGGEIAALNATIQALAPSQAAAQTSADDALAAEGGMADVGGGRGAGGGLLRGTTGAATGSLTNVAGNVGNTASVAGNATANATSRSNESLGGLNAAGVLTSGSRGVFGLEGLSLDASALNTTQSSAIVSNTQNVHLASGTQMVLRIQTSQ